MKEVGNSSCLYKGSLKQIYFVITRRCNLFCSHCIRSSGPDITDELSLEWAERTLRKLAPFAQNAMMVISGGEPTLHPAFENIVELACKLYKFTNINTNGLRPRQLLDLLDRHQNIGFQISIDGNEELHNTIRGVNTFSRSIATIEKLAIKQANVVVATTVGSTNLASLESLDQMLEQVPFSTWTIQKEVIYGRASYENAIPTSQWNEFALYVKDHFKNKDRIKINTMFDFDRMAFHETAESQANIFRNCGTGSSKLYINPDLTVYPCGCLEELILGDLSKDSVEDVLEAMVSLPISPSKVSPCRACPFFKTCGGGCPGASLHTFGTFGIGDPRCKAIRDLVVEAC